MQSRFNYNNRGPISQQVSHMAATANAICIQPNGPRCDPPQWQLQCAKLLIKSPSAAQRLHNEHCKWPKVLAKWRGRRGGLWLRVKGRSWLQLNLGFRCLNKSF